MTSQAQAKQSVTGKLRAMVADVLTKSQVPSTVYGVVSSVNSDGTANVTEAGSATITPNLKSLANYDPVQGDTVILFRVAGDLWILGTLGAAAAAATTMRARMNTAVAMANATETAVTFDTIDEDTGGTMTSGGAKSVWTCHQPGWYEFSANAWWGLYSSGVRAIWLNSNSAQWPISGALTGGPGHGAFAVWTSAADDDGYARQSISGGHRFAFNDYLLLKCYQTSGSPVYLNQASLSIRYIGP